MMGGDMAPLPSSDASLTGSAAFHTTRWSLVLSARANTEPLARHSLETLCRQYWPPLYAYVRHRGHPPHDAQDLTQEFFARLLEKDWLNAAEPARGRFRSFLLMAMKRFLANEWDRARAKKRGPGQPLLSLDNGEAESLYAASAPPALPADALFDRRWALTLLESVMHQLQEENSAAGRLAAYEILKPCLTASRTDLDYDSLAAQLRLTPASARSAVHRLRKRFRELFRAGVAGTVDNPADVDDELHAVIAALALD